MSKARNIARLMLSSAGKLPTDSIQSVAAANIKTPLSYAGCAPGQVLQVQTTYYNWYNSMTLTGSWQTVSGLSVNITPKFNNSKIRVDVRWFGEVSSAWDVTFGVTRNGTAINLPTQQSSRYGCLGMPNQSYVQDDNDSTPESSNFFTIDSPNTTSAITYAMVVRAYTSDSRAFWTGRVFNGTSTGSYEQGSTSITVTEYAV